MGASSGTVSLSGVQLFLAGVDGVRLADLRLHLRLITGVSRRAAGCQHQLLRTEQLTDGPRTALLCSAAAIVNLLSIDTRHPIDLSVPRNRNPLA